MCLRLEIICRPSREEIIGVINEILEYTYEAGEKTNLPIRNDSQMYREAAAAPSNAWLNDNLWAGFVPRCGPVWTTLVGSPDQLAKAFLEYKTIGVSQFIISGWPETDEIDVFGKEVLPKVRALEAENSNDNEALFKLPD